MRKWNAAGVFLSHTALTERDEIVRCKDWHCQVLNPSKEPEPTSNIFKDIPAAGSQSARSAESNRTVHLS